VLPRFPTYTFHHISVNFCGTTKGLGALERYFNKKILQKKTTKTLLKKIILIFVKLSKLVEDYHFLLSSKPLESNFCCLENIDF
jgi:hypothetical protein